MKMLEDTRPSALICVVALALGGWAVPPAPKSAPQDADTIIVAGRPVHTGTRVVTWIDEGGLDAYHTARIDQSGAPESYGSRRAADGIAIAAGDFDSFAAVVDQIVLHYDGLGDSRDCFAHLAERQLSAHFLIDVDGTVYQTLDLQERAYHATVANNRSIGIEIANVGAFAADGDPSALPRGDAIRGNVHGVELVQHVFTPAQYEALSKLIDSLCHTFPLIGRDYPRDASGAAITSKLPDEDLAGFRGILGHFHIQENKVDPGPALQGERILPR